MATEEEIENQRDRLDQLRAQVEDNERDRADKEREAANEITMANLKAEEARLLARLAEQESIAQRTGGDGAVSPVLAAQAEMERAQAIQKATAAQLTGGPAGEKPAETGPTPTAPPVPPVSPVEASTKNVKGGK